ncbi:MAG: hypothetical protein R3250_05830, partial [Melioribacteraceae bacterium]|nr:hypothetical protein [Melioribacteraceae bacterium]
TDETYTTIEEDPINLIYATEQMYIEKFENRFEYPEIYQGYPNGIIFIHSEDNDNSGSAEAINITYNELDNNENEITSDNSLSSFSINTNGQLHTYLNPTIITGGTEYIQFEANYGEVEFFDSAFFGSTFFKTN